MYDRGVSACTKSLYIFPSSRFITNQPSTVDALAVDTAMWVCMHSVFVVEETLRLAPARSRLKGQSIQLSFCIHVSYNRLLLVLLTIQWVYCCATRHHRILHIMRLLVWNWRLEQGWPNWQIHIESRRVDATCRGMLSNGWQQHLVAFWICSVSETRDVARALICTTICKSTVSDFPSSFVYKVYFAHIRGFYSIHCSVDELTKTERIGKYFNMWQKSRICTCYPSRCLTWSNTIMVNSQKLVKPCTIYDVVSDNVVSLVTWFENADSKNPRSPVHTSYLTRRM